MGYRSCQVEELIDQAKEAAIGLDAVAIGQYERRYDVYRKLRDKAEKNAAKELAALPQIDEKKLKQYLAEYRRDKKQTIDRNARSVNYIAARNVLDEIRLLNNPTRDEFISRYGQLVGAKGMTKLWHSGSIFRSINNVAKDAQGVVALIGILKDQLHDPVDVVYRVGMDRVQKMSGIGPNILTEILNTYSPRRYAVLNKNPLKSLAALGFTQFPEPSEFKPVTYANYCEYMTELRKHCDFEDLSDLDHFLNFVYWKYAKR